MASQQKISIPLPNDLSREERLRVGKDVVEYIKLLTDNGVNPKTNRNWGGAAGKYSKDYGKSPPVDLRLSGEMMRRLRVLDVKGGVLDIGYSDGSLNGKVEGNRLGTYGKPTPIAGKARDFLAINQKALNEIIKRVKDERTD